MFCNNKSLFVIDFVQSLKHTAGRWAGKKFDLLKWQYDIVSDVYGTINEKNMRQYEYIYLEVPKKNGKTELAAALGLYHTFADGEYNGEVYGCAAEKEQASIAFDVAVDMIDQSEQLKSRTKYIASKKIIEDKITKTKYKVLSAEAYSKHGYKPSAVIFDELHAQPNRDLWDIMTFGAGDIRDQPVWIIITTAGDDPDRISIGWEVHSKAKKIIEGELIDPRWYCKIFSIDEGDNIWDEGNWFKANPSLGITIDLEKVRAAATSAKNDEAEEKLFRWLRLNQWVALKYVGWLPLTLWDSTNRDVGSLTGKKCYGGLDLSSTGDLTALTLTFPPQEGLDFWYCLFYAWIPELGLQKRVQQGIPYDKWAREKHLMSTSGNAIDYDFVENTILTAAKKYEIVKIGVDPWNSRMLTQRIMRQGISVVEVNQTMAGMSPAMKYMEVMLVTGKMYHENNPVARWCFGNVNIAIDGNNNIKPVKNRSLEKIDITVSMINSIAVSMEDEMASLYEDRGLTIL